MKKLLLLAFAVLFATAMTAQNRMVLLQESFDDSAMPSGWTIVGQSNNWSVSATNNAGGSPNEMKLDWSPQFNGTTRLVTPAIDLTGISSVVFSFKHALDNYSGSNSIGVATSSDGGNTWNQVWTQPYSTNSSWLVNVTVNNADMGQSSVKFCIFFNGNSYNINDWYFDDVMIFTLENLDLGIDSSTLSDFFGSGEVGLGINVSNYGVTPVTSVQATYQVTGNTPVTETFEVNIPSLGSETLHFTTTNFFMPGSFDVAFSIDLVNGEEDDVNDNNIFLKTVSVALTSTERIPMIEHFSSSTCGPCVSVNTQMLNFCNNNPGRFTYTKYQMNWPGNGDPYYTTEGGTRRNYYGVSAVPQCFLDGQDQGYSAVQQSVFDQHAAEASFMDIRGSFTVEGNTIHVLVDVMPFVDVNARVFVSVNEKETHNNVGSNGETSFHHIFMKMLPDAEGTTVDFVSSELQRLEFTQDMSATHVEEMSDLEVSIWVQNYSTHEIYNSHFAYEYTDHPYPVENLTLMAGEDNTYMVNWVGSSLATPESYDVYVNGELVAERITETDYSFESETDFVVVGVVAWYDNENSSVMAVVSTNDAPQDLGMVVVGSNEVILDVENPSAILAVVNGNAATQTAFDIVSINETPNAGEIPYLVINAELPFTLEAGESYEFEIKPDMPETKSVANTTILVESTVGSVEFYVEIDGELLNVTEITNDTKIFPNPTRGNFVVEGANVAGVEVYNLVGQKVYEAYGKVVTVDAANWEKGLYLVNIKNQNGSMETRKLMVE